MATRKQSKDPAAVALGRKGGKARARKLTKAELSEQGRKAVQVRWDKVAARKAGRKKK